MRILVLDGTQNQAVACVRSLAHHGHTVIVGASSSWSQAGWSRFCHGNFTYPSPEQDANEFVKCVADLCRRERGTLVLPMTEATTLPLSEQREVLFETGARMVLPSHADLLRAFDKAQSIQLAESLGIRVPKTVLIANPAWARQVATSFPYPAVVKPCSSQEISSRGAVRATARPRYARNPSEFLTAYSEMSRHCSAVLAQEFVEGTGTGYFALMRHGELRVEFAHRRLRDVHPTGSGSSLRVSVEPLPEVRSAGLAMLQALNWHGVAMVEFRLADRQPPVFLEVNGRFWNSLPLACYAGVDFPVRLAQLAEKGEVEPVPGYRVGVRCRWLLGDFRHLLEVWRGAPVGYPGKFPGRLRTLLSFLTPVRGTFHDGFMLRDPLPEFADWLYSAHKAFVRSRLVRFNAQRRSSHP